jgi:tetratricopeptide (TPR) repeat protein
VPLLVFLTERTGFQAAMLTAAAIMTLIVAAAAFAFIRPRETTPFREGEDAIEPSKTAPLSSMSRRAAIVRRRDFWSISVAFAFAFVAQVAFIVHQIALLDFDQVLKLDPKHVLARYERGFAYFDKDDYDRAISDLDQAIQRDPQTFPGAYARRAEAYNHKGDHDRAIADASESILIGPEYADAYVTRGEIYEANNDLDHAIADFDRAMELVHAYSGDVAPLLAKARQGRERVRALLAKRSNPGAHTNAPPR